MAAIKSLNFLPEIFQTDTNKKFLSATIDQLISEPEFTKVNGYIGRRFAPTYKSTDNYIQEPSSLRQQYQLEPSVVIKNKKTDQIHLFSSYDDLLSKIQYYGGNISNHDRLFRNEYYSFDGHFDFDKFVNFNNYYWLPDGPEAVQVFAGTVDNEADFSVTRNIGASGYNFSGRSTETNPVLVLARGGTYTFKLNQPGSSFWIQSEPGISGVKKAQSNITTRQVFGVTNNGTDSGEITFRVPLTTAQDRFTRMDLIATVDYAINLPYTELQNQSLSEFLRKNPGGFDGAIENLDNKSIIFINEETTDDFWTTPESFDYVPFETAAGGIVPENRRRGVWTVRLEDSNGEAIIRLDPSYVVASNQKVFVKTGKTYATKEFYVDFDDRYKEVPSITAPLDRLYYQDSQNKNLVGEIRLVEPNNYKIDVTQDIIGAVSYTSPNGIVFTNGLKVQFDSGVTPADYADKEYYVEGVGTSISLVPVEKLVTPESYADNGIATPDYITINRNSIDYNAWSRSNRWFHIDVIKATAQYNNGQALSDNLLRAARPIIEFNGNLQLFNFGRVSIPNTIDILDDTVTDAFSNVEGQATFEVDGVEVSHGQRIIFTKELDLVVKNKIFVINIVTIDDQQVIHLVEDEATLVQPYHSVIVTGGAKKGRTYWFDGSDWFRAQQKDSINQSPLFDLFDQNEVSFSNKSVYKNSTFAGTKIFSYSIGTGANDAVLGFPLKYKNFNSVGDIEFTNNFDTDTISHLVDTQLVEFSANSGYLKKNITLGIGEFANVWTKNKEQTKQYQIISNKYDGRSNYFEVDVSPMDESSIAYTKVFVNNKLIKTSDYSYVTVGARQAVRIALSQLKEGDTVDILIYSNQVSKLGYYQVPLNLDLNAKNETFASLTLGQIRNHVKVIEENTSLIANTSGTFTGLRDIQYKQNGGAIVQHSSPLIYANLFLTDKTLNFVDGVELAAKEYSKFKNKFLETATKISNIDEYTIPGLVDEVLKTINSIKNKTFPWYYSDMVPYGDNKRELVDIVINPNIKQFDLLSVFNDLQLSNRAVLVYHNGVQLTKGQDYYFPQDRSAVIITDNVTLEADDEIRIVDYLDTDGCYIPETPTKLGLYPKFTPQIFVDNTYQDSKTVIEGHDGSKTIAFGDIRDQLILELEKRIYNNIKVNYETNLFELYNIIPGKFRSTDYSLAEFNQILSKSFLKWVGANRVDFTTNDYFESSNPWTWNYKKLHDVIDGEVLPGTWRAIFNYFFDTDRPHTNPWEMLGFSEEPDWWQGRYGPAPYTGGNTLLWSDLSKGYIHAGPRAGVDPRFIRTGLLDIIPVNEYGELRSPASFIVKDFDSISTNSSYSVGNQGPVEMAWRRSSEFPFAIQKAIAISSPGYYFGSMINADSYYRDSKIDQLVVIDSLKRISPLGIVIHGSEDENGNIRRSAGYLNWIRDNVRNLGIDPSVKLAEYLSNLDVNLGYKVAGFTDKKYLKVLAEQSSPTSTNDSVIVPDENITVHLNKSVPVKKIVYSGVIIEQSENGYTVSGYDLNNPYFTIIPSLANNNAYAIEVLGRRAVIYKDYQTRKVTVPYGHEFNTRQQVVDFLVSYSRFLVGQGFQFNELDKDLKEQRDWILSAKEFLAWSQQGWSVGNLIVLSPVFDTIRLTTNTGTVDFIQNSQNSSKILDQNFNVIKHSQLEVIRLDNQFKVSAVANQTICLAELDIVEHEHVLILDNQTVFSDIIYKPELGNRQYRLKLVGHKTANWTGALNPPGFVYNSPTVEEWKPGVDYRKGSIVKYKELFYTALYNVISTENFDISKWQQIDRSGIKTGLLPNFAYNAQKFENIYDIDNSPIDLQLAEYSAGIIGYRNRDYLSDFSLEQTSQAKFYQGFIKEKGTNSAVNSLTSATFNNISSNIDLYEEWAVRVGEYGAIDSDQILEFELSESTYTEDPVATVLLNNNDTVELTESGVVGIKQNELYKRPANFKTNIFYNRTLNSNYTNDILTAGYVNLEDVDFTIFDFTNYNELSSIVNKLGKGHKIWVAKDFDDDWNVYRVSETDNSVVEMSYNIDNIMSVSFNKHHDLAVGDVFAVKNFDTELNGFYRVTGVDDINTVLVEMYKGVAYLKKAKSVSATGVFFRLHSMRLDNLLQLDTITPLHGWTSGDTVWADTVDQDGRWAVYKKADAWLVQDVAQAQASEYEPGDNFGYELKINQTGDLVVISSPSNNTGTVRTFTRLSTGEYLQTSTIKPKTENTTGFGKAVDVSTNVIAVGAPTSNSNKGYVFVYNSQPKVGAPNLQVISLPSAADNDYFGTSVALSGDNKWLYVGAPGKSKVFVYKLMEYNIQSATDNIEGDGVTTEYTLAFTPIEANSITVEANGRRYVPLIDYTVNGDAITFLTGAPDQTITVEQGPYYKLVNSIGHESNDNHKFGYLTKTNYDGTDVLVSAPGHVVALRTDAGGMYFWSRRYESLRTRSGVSTLITTIPVKMPVNYTDLAVSDWLTNNSIAKTTDYTSVQLDGVELVPGVDYNFVDNNIVLTVPPESGRIVTVSTGLMDFSQSMYNPEPQVGAEFGKSIAVNKYSSAIYVSAPGYSESDYYSGKVYRYIDTAKYLGYIQGSANPTITIGHGIMINGFNVRFTGSTLDQVVADINNANVPGVFASVVDGAILISSDSKEARNKLEVHTNGTAGYTSLGLTVFQLDQTIVNTKTIHNEIFGSRIEVSDEDDTLLVSSERGNSIIGMSFDKFSKRTNDVSFVITNSAAERQAILEDVFASRPEWISFASQSLSELADQDERWLVNEQTSPLTKVETTYDSNSTRFIDSVRESGTVYVYELIENAESSTLNTGSWVRVQQLTPSLAYKDDQFGYSVDLSNGIIVVGSPNAEALRTAINPNGILNGGLAHIFANNGTKSWAKVREQNEKVDLDSLNRLFVFNKDTQTILENLDFVDPAKGKILGVAEQDLDFKTSTDPAIYNNGTRSGLIYNIDFHWSEQQVGMVWWDLSKVRYIDYEQDTLTYRIKNWGSMFPGSEIEVCEWVESNVPPAQYPSNKKNGSPKYEGATAYVENKVVDAETGIIRSKYYFWVKNKATTTSSSKTNSVVKIANIIENPQTQGISYGMMLRSDSLGLSNVKRLIKGNTSVVHIDYAHVKNTNSVHAEYELIQENRGESIIPDRIFNKLVDSLAGQDVMGNIVPDPMLNANESLGIAIRPRQTMIKNRYVALKNFVEYINKVFAQYPVVNQFNISKFYSEDPLPAATEYDGVVDIAEELQYINLSDKPVGYKVLVKSDSNNNGLWVIYYLDSDYTFDVWRIQAYRTDLYWTKANWFATDYDPTTKVDFTVDTEKDISKLKLAAGKIIRVRYNQQGYFTIYRVTADLTLETVGIENGTIQLLPTIYNASQSNAGFGSDAFDNLRFDKNPGIEIREIINAIKEDIFINELKAEFNKMFFVLIHYIMTEQKYVDWIFKTSFVSVVHQLRKLDQFPSFIKDNQDYYVNYVNEIKPYRTQIREYLLDYSGNDTFAGDVTDFDLPAYYDNQLGMFRSPSGEIAKDATLLTSSKYQNWLNNYAYKVTDFVIGDAGQGYTIEPVITISGGGGTGATARAIIDYQGSIVQVLVTNPGHGYTSTPTVTVNGNGTGAKVYAKLGDSKARHFNSTIKFDRISYESTIPQWKTTGIYDVGTIVSYKNEAYKVIPASYVELSGNVSVDVGDIISQPNTDANLTANTARVIQNATVKGNILIEPLNGTFVTNDSEMSISIGSDNTQVYPVTVTNLERLDPSEYFEYNRFEKVNGADVGSTADRVSVYYKPNEGLAGTSLDQVINGVIYPGVRITGQQYFLDWNNINDWTVEDKLETAKFEESAPYFTGNGYIKPGVRVLYNNTIYEKSESGLALAPVTGSVRFDESVFTKIGPYIDIDTVISSRYADSTLGTKPEDINVTGGAYVDSFNSHAPEELVPGVTFDTLNMQVFSKLPDENITMAFRVSTTPDLRFETRITASGNLTANSNEIVVSDVTKFSIGDRVIHPMVKNIALVNDIFPGNSTIIISTKALSSANNAELEVITKTQFVDKRAYHRISDENSTFLSEDLHITDTVIHVTDSSKLSTPDPVLARPGVVYINGEKITYYTKDDETNTLGQIRRGVDQTGAPLVHSKTYIGAVTTANFSVDRDIVQVNSISGISVNARVIADSVEADTIVTAVYANSRIKVSKNPITNSTSQDVAFEYDTRVVDSGITQVIPGDTDNLSWGSKPLWLTEPARVMMFDEIINVQPGDYIQQFVSNVVNTTYFSGITAFDTLPYDTTNFEQAGELIEYLNLHANSRVIANSVIDGTQVISVLPEVVEITNEDGDAVNNLEYLIGTNLQSDTDPILGELLYLTRNKIRIVRNGTNGTLSNAAVTTYQEINTTNFTFGSEVPEQPLEFDPWQRNDKDAIDSNEYQRNTAYVYIDGNWHYLSSEGTSGLDVSSEPQVVFLKQKPSFTP